MVVSPGSTSEGSADAVTARTPGEVEDGPAVAGVAMMKAATATTTLSPVTRVERVAWARIALTIEFLP
jgi:hypothetical protein